MDKKLLNLAVAAFYGTAASYFGVSAYDRYCEHKREKKARYKAKKAAEEAAKKIVEEALASSK